MAAPSDLSQIQAGYELPSYTTASITPVTLALFAGGSGDHNPIHLDARFAQANGFPDVFAHGMLSMAFLGRLLTQWAKPENIRGFGVRFGAITPIRSEVTCSGKVTEVVEEAGERLAKLEITAKLPDGTVTLTGDATILLA
jgi:acyl dehydratase